MAVERRFFIATTAEEVIDVKTSCFYVGDFDNGQIWHDIYTHNLWYLDKAELNEGEEEKLNQWSQPL